MMAAAVFDFSATRKAFEAEIHEAERVSSMTLLQERFMKLSGSETEKKSTLDQAFRDVLKDHIVKESGCDVYLSVISLAVDCAKEGLCLGMIPFLMLDDVFSSVTLDVCERVFKFVEDGVSIWKKEPYYTGGKNYLLRMCNDLLRRLSRSQNTVFCGRIQLFLARLFPLEEKSGLNLQSHFNLENVTSYNLKGDDSTMRSEDRDRDESMEMEEGEMSDSHSSFTPIDYNLYRKFWSIQDFFRNPNQCYKKDLWKSFASNSDEVLKCFESHKLDDVQASKKKKEMLAGDGGNVYFAKYLTSEKLLDLQLADSNFRRYVLVQFLILFQYLNAQVKFKAPNLVVTDEQALWIKNATDIVYKLLRETPPDGDQFAKMVQHTLEREENWITWKNKGCPTYDRERRVSTRRPACSAGLQCGSSHTRDVFASTGGREKMAPGPQTLAIPLRIARGRGRPHMAEAMRRHLAVFRRSSAREEEIVSRRLLASRRSPTPASFELRRQLLHEVRGTQRFALRPWETSVLRDFGSWRRRRCVAVLIEQPRLQRFFGVFDIRAPPHRLQQAELSRSFAIFLSAHSFHTYDNQLVSEEWPRKNIRPATSRPQQRILHNWGLADFWAGSSKKLQQTSLGWPSRWQAVQGWCWFQLRASPAIQITICRDFPFSGFSQRVTPATTSTCRDLQQLLPGGADYFSRRPTTDGTVCFTCISRCSTSGAASIIMWPAAVVAVVFGRCRALSDAVFSSRYSAAGGAAYISMRCGPATRWAVFSSRYSTAGGAPYVSMRCGPATRWAVFSSRYPAAGGAPHVSMRCDLAARWAVVSSRCPATTGADYVSRCPTAGGAVDYVSRCRATGDFISHCLTARRADNGSRGKMDSGILQIKRLEIKTGFHIALTESQGGIGNGSLFDAVTAGGRCPG
ncbi:THOC1 [Branchiostoma lanceolatum]|uniref:THOC1 protein n=1 Tax=Branchiostoma lanceolatum TaxID=7740 RepID=A0A8J9ZH94_BRALA|nr:THOC1 [Branchiostoma lanceolatum]